MTSESSTRIESIDLLKGLVMVIMALDHTRDYVHASAFYIDPTDPAHTTIAAYLTRWITHFCAPIFSFLAGISAFLMGRKKTKSELSGFLIKRGLWLMFLELTVINFAWYFDWQFRTPTLVVIWVLGVSMVVLGALIHLPRTAILIFSLVLIAGHNLLDNVHFDGNYFWAILHEFNYFPIGTESHLVVGYPIIPWIAVMSLGYYFGSFYDKKHEATPRRKTFNIIGMFALLLFVVIRYINKYGDPTPWLHYDTHIQSLMSFMNPNKYPPSLLYLLMTLGGAFLFLANSESWRGKVVKFFVTFGRVPFFYYVLHLYLIHLIAMALAHFTDFGWQAMILPTWVSLVTTLQGYGFDLWVVYLVWIVVIMILYPLCRKFDLYKSSHKEKWWLSYL